MATIGQKYFISTDAGAPAVNSSAGSLSSFLRACMVDGFNLKPCSSVSMDYGVASVNIGFGHGFEAGRVIALNGASPSSVNGEYEIKSVTSDSILFKVDIDVASVASADVRFAPLGWKIIPSSDEKLVFTANYSESSMSRCAYKLSSESGVSALITVHKIYPDGTLDTLIIDTISVYKGVSPGRVVLIGDAGIVYVATGAGVNRHSNCFAMFGDMFTPGFNGDYELCKAVYSSSGSQSHVDNGTFSGAGFMYAAGRYGKSEIKKYKVNNFASVYGVMDSQISAPCFTRLMIPCFVVGSADRETIGVLPGVYMSATPYSGNGPETVFWHKKEGDMLLVSYISGTSSNNVTEDVIANYYCSVVGFDMRGPWR